MARGGKREGAGRPMGGRSAATRDQIAGISDLAKMHSADALNALVAIATGGESEAARVSAANAILDRAYGKPQQAVALTGGDGGPVEYRDVTDIDDATLAAIAAGRRA